MTAARTFAAFALDLDLDHVPADVQAATKLHALDVIGCGLAASVAGVGGEPRAALTQSDGPSTVIGRASGSAAADAAFANGTLCHALDFDDTHARAIAHISTVIVPAALAAAEEQDSNGAELLAAILAGNEIAIRIGAAAAGGFHKRGFHPTSVCGVFGAAAAAGRLRGLSAEQTTRALGIAGSFASGIFEYLADGSATKPLHAGWGAHGGLLAAAFAAHGATGPETVLEGRFGVFATHQDDPAEIEAELAMLGRAWETPAIAYKPYPACHYVHSPIDAARAALGDATVAPDEVIDVRVEIPEGAVSLTLEPAESKRAPRTPYEAKFSIPYAVAAAIVRGEVDVATFAEPHLSDPELLAVAERVRYDVVDFDSWPGAFPGRVEIELSGGRRVSGELLYERGSARNPLSDDAVLAKYRANAALALDPESLAALEDALLGLEEHGDLDEALAPLRRAAAGITATEAPAA